MKKEELPKLVELLESMGMSKEQAILEAKSRLKEDA